MAVLGVEVEGKDRPREGAAEAPPRPHEAEGAPPLLVVGPSLALQALLAADAVPAEVSPSPANQEDLAAEAAEALVAAHPEPPRKSSRRVNPRIRMRV